MEFAEHTLDGGELVIAPTGRLNAVAAPRLRSLVTDRVAAGSTRIVLDLTDVIFMDSSGLGAVIASLKAAREAGGDLRMTNAQEPVLMILRLSKVDKVLPIYPSATAAFA